MARQDSSKASLFLLVYGRQVRLPVELTLKAAIKENEEEEEKEANKISEQQRDREKET